MFALLIRIRLRGLANAALRATRAQKTLGIALLGLSTLIFLGVFAVFLYALESTAGDAERDRLIFELFFFLQLFLLAGSVPFVASALLQSNDLTLLLAAPLRNHAIVAAKLVDAGATNALQFLVIGLPAVVAAAVALNLSALGWLAWALLVAAFMLLPAAATGVVLLLALAAFGAARVRRAVAAANLLLGLVVCLVIVSQVQHVPLLQGLGVTRAYAGTADSPALHAPSALFVHALLGLAGQGQNRGATATAAALGLSALVFGICVLLGQHLLTAESLAEGGERRGSNGSRSTVRAQWPPAWSRVLPPAVTGLVGKDLRYVWRDSILASQLAVPMILVLVPFVAMGHPAVRANHLASSLYIMAIALNAVVIFMQTSILSLSSMGLESRGAWLVLTSPNSGPTLVWAKFVMSVLLCGSIGTLLGVLSTVFFGAPVWIAGLQCLLAVIACIGLCGLGVGLSAALPRFIYENPTHRVSPWALIFGFVGATLYCVAVGSIVTAAAMGGLSHPERAPSFIVLGALWTAAVTALAAVVPLAVGARRLSTYEWTH